MCVYKFFYINSYILKGIGSHDYEDEVSVFSISKVETQESLWFKFSLRTRGAEGMRSATMLKSKDKR